MKRFPNELSELLSPAGLRVLTGRHPISGGLAVAGTQFLTLARALDAKRASEAFALLERRLLPHLQIMETKIPPETLYGMTKNYSETLPKVMRCKTAYLEHKRERAFAVAHELNLTTMLQSDSFHALAEAVSGQRLRKRFGQQVLCYGAGDYQGPHNDHHPEERLAENGYIDLHFSLTAPRSAHQQLVYAKRGHLSETATVTGLGTMTAYRLPFWHYTTPLQAHVPGAHRWVLLGTFLFA